jgi:hypothetical protein
MFVWVFWVMCVVCMLGVCVCVCVCVCVIMVEGVVHHAQKQLLKISF